MGDISFKPTFKDIADYRDGEDPVRAEGPNGFNDRFTAIESDLKQLSAVAAAIDAKLDQLATAPPPTTRRLTLPLRIVGSWDNGVTGAAEASPGERAGGTMNLAPPDGVRLLSLRAAGQAIGTPVHISLFSQPLGGGQVDTMATIDADGNPFDVTGQIGGTASVVNTSSFHYWISASCGITAPDTVTVVISALQLTFSS